MADATADARLFAEDAVRAARAVMAGEPVREDAAAYLAVFALLACEALWPGGGVPGRNAPVVACERIANI